MTFVTRQETTWGELREGEQIVDKLDRIWTLGKPERIGPDVRVTIEVRPHAEIQSVVVVKPATDTVTVIREATATVTDIFEARAGLEQDKAVIEEKLGPTTEILPVIDTATELRSHLYLLHGFMVHEATTRAALLEHHRQSHKLEADAEEYRVKDGKGYTPHEHKEEA